jgi:hypothetical protein
LILFCIIYQILDEGHKIKSESTLVSQGIRAIQRQHTLLLTGTPLQVTGREQKGGRESVCVRERERERDRDRDRQRQTEPERETERERE